MLDTPLGTGQFHVQQGQIVLTNDSNATQNFTALSPMADALAGVLAQGTSPPALQTVDWPAGPVQFSVADINAIIAAPPDQSFTLYAQNSGAYGDRFAAVAFEHRGVSYVTLAATATGGVATFAVGDDGALTPAGFVSGTGDGFTDTPTALCVVGNGGGQYVVSISATDNSITSLHIGPGGTLTPVSNLGAEHYLPIATPQDVASVTVAGHSFVIVASAGSSSLTVLSVDAHGTLTPTDQVTDDMTTRIRGAHVVETFVVGNQAYVLAAGSDSGISLYSLLPDGTLVHLETLVDQVDFPIDLITDMHVAVVGGEYQLFTTSATEPGVGQFTLALDGVGDTIITDTQAADTLVGGAGADLFILTGDGQVDTITHFQPGTDQLDLSGYGFYYHPSQLTITPTADGAVVTFAGETLIIHTADGTPLGADDFTTANTTNTPHVGLDWVMDAGVDFSFASHNSDVVRGGDGDDHLTTGGGDDWVDGRAGNDHLNGGDGNDALLGRSGDDHIFGGTGNDNIAAHTGDDTVYGGHGNDSLGGSFGDDLMYGGDGDDVIGSGAQNDLIDAGNGHDVASGGWGVDQVFGGAGGDTLAGSYGNDTVRGGAGDDNIGGGTGTDYMYGGDGDDLIGAGHDDDFVFGGNGHDFLGGGAGHDALFGGAGDDKINPGDGSDTITGGAGADTYVFDAFTTGEIDVITDFELGIDTIRLRKIAGRFDGLDIENITINGQSFAR